MQSLPGRDLRTTIALWHVGHLSSWDLPPIAELLLHDHESPNLVLLAMEDGKSPGLHELFERCLRDIGEPAMEAEELERLVLWYYGRELASGRPDTWALMDKAFRFCEDRPMRTAESKELAGLIESYQHSLWVLEGLSDPPAAALEEQRLKTVKAFGEWEASKRI